MNYHPKELGFKLRSARELRKLTQKEASDLLDIHVRTLGSIEKGESDVSFKLLCKAADIFNIPLPKLLNMEEASVMNSFNNIHEKAHVNNHSKIEMDSEWLSNRFSFLEEIIIKMQEERVLLLKHLESNS